MTSAGDYSTTEKSVDKRDDIRRRLLDNSESLVGGTLGHSDDGDTLGSLDNCMKPGGNNNRLTLWHINHDDTTLSLWTYLAVLSQLTAVMVAHWVTRRRR